MQSSVIGKIEKARRYAQEKDRIGITSLAATFRGDHGDYSVDFTSGVWACTCAFFLHHGLCSHSMTLQRVMEPMLPE